MFHLILNHQADLIKSYFRNLKNNNIKDLWLEELNELFQNL